jgi:chromosome segregation ATPase
MAVTGVARELSDKVNELGTQMTVALQKTAEQTTDATLAVAEKLEKYSARNADQLEDLIEQLQAHANDAKEMDYQFASLNEALGEITGDVNAMSERLQELTLSLERLRGSANAHRA